MDDTFKLIGNFAFTYILNRWPTQLYATLSALVATWFAIRRLVGVNVMRFLTLAFLVILTFLLWNPVVSAQLLPSQARGSARAQIVMVSVNQGCAAGIIVGYDETLVYVATAAHIADLSDKALPSVTVRFNEFDQFVRNGQFLSEFQKPAAGDLAVITVNRDVQVNRFLNDLDFALLSPVPIGPLNAPVTSIGCFGGAVWSSGTSETLLSSDQGYLRFQSDVGEGQSGGGLFNEAWELIGMPLNVGPNGIYARPFTSILEDLRKWRVPVRLTPRSMNRRAKGADEIAREMTAFAASRQLAAKAENHVHDNVQLMALLAVQATRYAPTNEALVALARTWDHTLERTLYGRASLRTVTFSPDAQRIAVGALDGKLTLWDTQSGTELQTLDSGASFVASVAFSPDGKLLVAACGRDVVVWDARSGVRIRTLVGHSDAVYTVTFTSDGSHLASGSGDHKIILWDTKTWRIERYFEGHTGAVYTVSFNPSGKILASGSEDKNIILWNVIDGTRVRTIEGREYAIFCVAFSPDGKFVAAGYGNVNDGSHVTLNPAKDLVLWDAQTGALVRTLTGHDNAVTSVAFGPDGKTLVSGSGDKHILVWDTSNTWMPRLLEGHRAAVTSVAVSPNGKLLASVGEDQRVILWTGPNGSSHEMLEGHKALVTSVAFSPDNSILASGSKDNEIILWDPMSGKRLSVLRGHSKSVNAVAFSPDGKLLASGGGDSRIILWSMQTRAQLKTISAPSSVYAIAFTTDGTQLASGGFDNDITVWDVGNGSRLRTLHAKNEDLLSLAFSPDGKLLASGSRLGVEKLMVWDIEKGNPVKILTDPENSLEESTEGILAFSSNGQQLAVAASQKAAVLRWDTATFSPLPRLQSSTLMPNGMPGIVYGLAFSANGRYLAQGYDLWDAEDGTRLSTLENQTFVHDVAFSPDAKKLALARDDHKVILWDLELTNWQAHACRMAGRDFTPSEWQQFVGDKPYTPTCAEFLSPQVSPK